MKNEITEKFGGQLRVRVCGVLVQDQKVLMVKHRGLSDKGYFWSPPGGGATFQTSLVDSLKQEFLEETGLLVEVHELLFVNEFHRDPLHALEIFFRVTCMGGTLRMGHDPELGPQAQIIESIAYWGIEDFRAENGPQLHSAFQNLRHVEQILKLRGYFQNWK